MNKITGIIAEFNPFHKGHEYLLNQIEGIKIVAMSGNWMQRGEPAIFDKWTRAQMALACGADLVVELPVTASVQAADFFASGAVDILKNLGITDLAFGSESAIDYNEIADMCRKTEEPVFLTKNGEGDLVVMDIGTYNRREKMLKLREELLAVEEDRMRGSKGYSVEEVTAMMRNAIREAEGHGTAE